MGNLCIATIINEILSGGSSGSIQCDFENSNCCSTVIETVSSSSSSTPKARPSIDTEIASLKFKSIDTEIK